VGEFIVAHKLALLLIGAAIGGFVLLTRGKGGQAQAANGIPVNPYNANSPADSGGGGFDLSSLLPAGPAGPALDPSATAPSTGAVADAPVAGETPAAVDNAPSGNGIAALANTVFAGTPYDQLPTSVQDGLQRGYPIQPNGSVLTSDITTPEAIPVDSTFGNGRTLENYGGGSSTGTGTAPAMSLPQPVFDLSGASPVQVGTTADMPRVPLGKVYAT
jgi:hypothetical protein